MRSLSAGIRWTSQSTPSRLHRPKASSRDQRIPKIGKSYKEESTCVIIFQRVKVKRNCQKIFLQVAHEPFSLRESMLHAIYTTQGLRSAWRKHAPLWSSLTSTGHTFLLFQEVPPNENYKSKVIFWHSPTIHTTAILRIILRFLVPSHLSSGNVTSARKNHAYYNDKFVLAAEPWLGMGMTEQMGQIRPRSIRYTRRKPLKFHSLGMLIHRFLAFFKTVS